MVYTFDMSDNPKKPQPPEEPPKARKEIPLISVPNDRDMIAEEMEELFDRLFATELPYHDIHGRPTVIQLSLHELHNRFRRSG